MKLNIQLNDKKDDPIMKALVGQASPDQVTLDVSMDTLLSLSTEQIDALILGEGSIDMDGFIGYVEADISLLAEDVPKEFPNSVISVDEETSRQKKWDEYTNYKVSLDSKKVLLCVGYHGANGNRKDIVKSDEFKLWYAQFGREAFYVSDKLRAKIASDYVIPEKM